MKGAHDHAPSAAEPMRPKNGERVALNGSDCKRSYFPIVAVLMKSSFGKSLFR